MSCRLGTRRNTSASRSSRGWVAACSSRVVRPPCPPPVHRLLPHGIQPAWPCKDAHHPNRSGTPGRVRLGTARCALCSDDAGCRARRPTLAAPQCRLPTAERLPSLGRGGVDRAPRPALRTRGDGHHEREHRHGRDGVGDEPEHGDDVRRHRQLEHRGGEQHGRPILPQERPPRVSSRSALGSNGAHGPGFRCRVKPESAYAR